MKKPTKRTFEKVLEYGRWLQANNPTEIYFVIYDKEKERWGLVDENGLRELDIRNWDYEVHATID